MALNDLKKELLCEEQLHELKILAEEDELKDSQSPDEFKKATEQWRTK
jgi:hypothetical protein